MKELLLFGFNLSKIIAYQSFTNKMLKTILFFHAMFYVYFFRIYHRYKSNNYFPQKLQNSLKIRKIRYFVLFFNFLSLFYIVPSLLIFIFASQN